jgi:hypothetical protein
MFRKDNLMLVPNMILAGLWLVVLIAITLVIVLHQY